MIRIAFLAAFLFLCTAGMAELGTGVGPPLESKAKPVPIVGPDGKPGFALVLRPRGTTCCLCAYQQRNDTFCGALDRAACQVPSETAKYPEERICFWDESKQECFNMNERMCGNWLGEQSLQCDFTSTIEIGEDFSYVDRAKKNFSDAKQCNAVNVKYFGHGRREKCKSYVNLIDLGLNGADQCKSITLDSDACSVFEDIEAARKIVLEKCKMMNRNCTVEISGNQCTGVALIEDCVEAPGTPTRLKLCVNKSTLTEEVGKCYAEGIACSQLQAKQSWQCLDAGDKKVRQNCCPIPQYGLSTSPDGGFKPLLMGYSFAWRIGECPKPE